MAKKVSQIRLQTPAQRSRALELVRGFTGKPRDKFTLSEDAGVLIHRYSAFGERNRVEEWVLNATPPHPLR